jgi:sec-independent protein translocase protein TatB
VFNLQGSEIIVILLLALVVLGPEKLPDAIRKFSQTYAELKKMGNGFQSELKTALDEPMREMRETADLVKRAADPERIAEEAESEARLRSEADAAMLAATPDVPVSEAALAVSDPVAAAEPAAEPEQVNGKKINQIAASMARGPIEPAGVGQNPNPPSVPARPITAPPAGTPADLAPPMLGDTAGAPSDTP